MYLPIFFTCRWTWAPNLLCGTRWGHAGVSGVGSGSFPNLPGVASAPSLAGDEQLPGNLRLYVSFFVKHCPTCSATSALDCHGLGFHCQVLSAVHTQACGLQMFTLWFVSGGEPLVSLWSCLGWCIPGVHCLQDLSRCRLTCIRKISF